MPELDRKSTSIFAGKVVRKDLVRKVKVGANVRSLSLSIFWASTAPPMMRLPSRRGFAS